MEERTKGDEANQQSIFDSPDEQNEYDREQYRAGIKKARNALFFAGGLMFVVDMFMLLMQNEQMSETYLAILIAFDVILLASFIGLGFWTKRKPYTAILVGLILFCAVQVLAMIGDPTNIYKGVIVKVVVVASLISGLKKARALQRMDNFEIGKF